MNELHAAAREYAERWKLPVLPLEVRGKRPLGRLVPHGFKDASSDPAVIDRWYRRAPEAGSGIRTGDGLAVLDVDPRHGGDLTLDAYLAEAGARLPRTPEVHTGGGGSHHYFRAPRGLRSAVLGQGLDLKGEGGYVVAPPSTHPNGRSYVWHPYGLADVPLAPLPAWLLAALPKRSSAAATASRAGDAADPLRAIAAAEYVPVLTGRALNRRGFVQCPFHADGNERSASLKVYEHTWFCFGCEVGGSIYDLAGLVAGYGRPLRGAPFLTVQAALLDHFSERRAA